jgi:hypothetical protein
MDWNWPQKAISVSNLGGPGGTRTPDALLRTEEKKWVEKF